MEGGQGVERGMKELVKACKGRDGRWDGNGGWIVVRTGWRQVYRHSLAEGWGAEDAVFLCVCVCVCMCVYVCVCVCLYLS